MWNAQESVLLFIDLQFIEICSSKLYYARKKDIYNSLLSSYCYQCRKLAQLNLKVHVYYIRTLSIAHFPLHNLCTNQKHTSTHLGTHCHCTFPQWQIHQATTQEYTSMCRDASNIQHYMSAARHTHTAGRGSKFRNHTPSWRSVLEQEARYNGGDAATHITDAKIRRRQAGICVPRSWRRHCSRGIVSRRYIPTALLWSQERNGKFHLPTALERFYSCRVEGFMPLVPISHNAAAFLYFAAVEAQHFTHGIGPNISSY